MTDTRRVFELLDVPKFAYPSVIEMDPVQTASNILDRINGGVFMSYARPVGLLPRIVKNQITQDEIAGMFKSYKHEWKNANQRDVAAALYAEFSGKGVWYPIQSRQAQIFEGLWFKPSIKGVWFFEGVPYMVGVNPRKSQILVGSHLAFLARGMQELYGIDDPNDPLALIFDLSVAENGKNRAPRKTILLEDQMISSLQFEDVMRRFFEALRIAGIEAVPRKIDDITDMLRRPKGQ